MVILDEKVALMHPPPPYAPNPRQLAPPPPFPAHQRRPCTMLAALPAHLLLHVVYMTFLPDAGHVARQRKTLYWLSTCLRTVNRSLYIGALLASRAHCAHIP